jgi:XTP/dITP diphosphohydrolase
MKKLVLATHNEGKAREFDALLGPFGVEITTAGALGLPDVEETGTTFAENALLKARAVSLATGEAALADDSGLCVSALGGDPGLYSARWAGEGRDWPMAMRKIQDKIGDNPDRSAFFICMLALVRPDGNEILIKGRVDGTIVWPPRGDKGHGYDPIFQPDGMDRTFAEMEQDEKNAISHRGRALRKLVERCFR